jgi:FimV-like protein
MALLGLTLLIPSLSWAVSLGRLSLNSALNQPLAATIDLTNVRSLSSDEIRVGLAPKGAFEELGVQWSYTLDDISLRVEPSTTGVTVIVTTDKPIVEPFLNFVVEVLWPKGRMIREYAVLLDPPVLMAPGIIAPRADKELSAADKEPSAADKEPSAAYKEPSASSEMTQAGDTLWEIALAERPSRAISVQEMMLAIQRLNPEAFIDANINRLKAGYVLQMPSSEEFSRLNTFEAIAEVAEQNRALNQDPTGKKKTVEPDLGLEQSVEPDSEGQLVILAEEASVSVEVLEPDTSAAAAETALMRAEAEVAEAAQESVALQSRLSAFEAQLADLAGAVSIKDAQIARLQKQLADLERPIPTPDNPFLATTTIGLLVIVVLLVVGLLLVSARLRRLSRNLQLTPSGGEGPGLEAGSVAAQEKSRMPPASAEDVPEESQADPAGAHLEQDPVVTAAESTGSGVSEGNGFDSTLENADDEMIEIDLDDLETLDDLEALDLDEIEDEAVKGQAQVLAEPADELARGEDEDDPAADEDPASMLDLARAYVEMEHHQEARKLLARVIEIGLPHEVADAQQMLASLTE